MKANTDSASPNDTILEARGLTRVFGSGAAPPSTPWTAAI